MRGYSPQRQERFYASYGVSDSASLLTWQLTRHRYARIEVRAREQSIPRSGAYGGLSQDDTALA